MNNILIVATTSYAGMGPYVSEIVNTFSPVDGIYFFFHDYEDDFYRKNVKKELHGKSVFYKEANSSFNKLKNLFFNKNTYDDDVFKLCRKNRIQLVHYINGIPSVKVQERMERNGIFVLSTVHDLYPHEAKKAWYKMLRHNIIIKRQNTNLQKAKFLVTNSIEQYEIIKRVFPDKEVAFHSFPSLVTKEIKNGKDVPRELKDIDKPYILFFGRVEEYKGCQFLYKAFIECKELQDNYYLVLAGKGQHCYPHDNHARNVIWMNRYVKDEEIAELYKCAACVVYPYLSATQSGVLSLAFYFQTPTITSDIPFFKSIIEPYKAGVTFQSKNVQDLTDKIKMVMAYDTSFFCQNGKNYYDMNYNGEAIRKTLLEIYALGLYSADKLCNII